jgi:hypothetical protein
MPSQNAANKGDEAEDLIEAISSVMFLRDFVVRNPKFKKQNGQEKELSDVLIPFEDVAISIQVKSKTVDVENVKPEIIRQRVKKVLDEGVGQLRNTRLIVDEGRTVYLKNIHGIDIPLNSAIVKKIHGIVIGKIYGAGKQLNVPGGFEYRHDMPIHIFSAEDFEAISSEIDTIPDFIRYLDVRAQLFQNDKINPNVRELDLLTTFKTQPDALDDILSQEGGVVVINAGIWEGYITNRQKEIKKRNELNIPSYLYDLTIKELSSVIGYAPDVINPSNQQAMEKGTVESYWKGIYELSKLSRLDRRIFGTKMMEKAKQADTDAGYGYSLFLTAKDEAIFFYSAGNISRQERIDRLYNLTVAAYLQKDLRKITAVATEPMSGPGRSFDLIYLEDVKFPNAKEFLASMPRLFSDPKQYSGYEYTGEEEN